MMGAAGGGWRRNPGVPIVIAAVTGLAASIAVNTSIACSTLGFDNSVTVTVSGGISAGVKKNNTGSYGSSVIVFPEDTLNIQQTTAGSGDTYSNCTVTIGSVSGVWSTQTYTSGSQNFTSAGTFTFTAPAGFTTMSVTVNAGGGGSGGGEAWSTTSGGKGGPTCTDHSGGDGTNGGNSSFGALMTALGGGGGGGASGGNGGAGVSGTASGGNISNTTGGGGSGGGAGGSGVGSTGCGNGGNGGSGAAGGQCVSHYTTATITPNANYTVIVGAAGSGGGGGSGDNQAGSGHAGSGGSVLISWS